MLATDPWSELVIHQCPRPNINNALLVWEWLANSVAIPDMPSSISWCTWLKATAFSRDWVTHAVAQPCLQPTTERPLCFAGRHWTDQQKSQKTLDAFTQHARGIYTLYWIFGTTKLCIYKVKSLVVLNMSHINWRGHSLLRPPNRIIRGICPSVPRFRRYMVTGWALAYIRRPTIKLFDGCACTVRCTFKT